MVPDRQGTGCILAHLMSGKLQKQSKFQTGVWSIQATIVWTCDWKKRFSAETRQDDARV
jgi:hypothetical protein